MQIRINLPAVSRLIASLARPRMSAGPVPTGGLSFHLQAHPDEALRMAREEATADQQARTEAFLALPEAQGREHLAVALAGTEATLEQARMVLRSAPRSARSVA